MKRSVGTQAMSWRRFGAAVLAGLVLATSPLAAPHGHGQVVQGTASALDGDTIELDGQLIQLFGIDAPELGQTCLNRKRRWRCGLEAAFALRRQLANEPITCTVQRSGGDIDEASCVIALGDVAEIMVTKGLAQALDNAFPSYLVAERAARAARLGLWRGEFVPPSEWRAGRRLPALDDAPVQICDIKGTIGASGQRIYLVPTDPDYEAAAVDLEKGERLFCSDDEAWLAGWRRTGRSANR